MSFERFLTLVQERDRVKAGTVNKPLRTTDQNVRYLWDVLQAAGIGSTVYLHRQTVEPEVHKGMAVWLNPDTTRFERCLAFADVDGATGVVYTANSAQVWGVVTEKINATLAEILLFGVVDLNLSEAVADSDDLGPGVYYLSSSQPGKLTRQKPPVSVAVLRATTDGKVFVMPQFVDFLDRHTHYRFSLTCAPAGDTTPPAPGGTHAITSPNVLTQGWLPAGHSSFNGKAPPGAVFGYNLEAHTALKNLWPPQPFNNAYLEFDRGEDSALGFIGVPLGSNGLCVADRYGIWWMSNCYGDVPWPTALDTETSDSYSDSSDVECPRHLQMAMQLWFTKINFATDLTSVLSLHSGDNRIRVRCYGKPDQVASTGHLELFLNLNLVVKDDQPGYLAFKDFDPEKAEFKRGPVVEGFYKLSNNVTLVGTKVGEREIGDTTYDLYQGLVGIAVAPEETLELPVQLVRLKGVEEDFFQDLMYLAFRPAVQEEYRAKLVVPSDLAIPNPQMKIRMAIMGRAAGTLPVLTVTARRAARPEDGLGTPLSLPLTGAEFSVTIDTQGVLTLANQYVEAESEPFDVAPGDTVFFTVRRLATDGYGADVGILRQSGILLSGEDDED